MDRSPNDPQTRAGSTPQHGIAHAPAGRQTEHAEISAETVRDNRPSGEDMWHGHLETIPDAGRSDSVERSAARTLQDQFTELLSVRSISDLQERVRANPLGAVVFAAGIGFALQRTHLLNDIVGGMLSGDEPAELTAGEERLLAWLNDAYALEKAQIPILENHADDARWQPHVRDRDLQHLERTKQHVKMVEKCIRLLGRKPAKVKSAVGRIAGAVSSLSTEPFDDEVVRNFLADFASENLEVASYQAIIVAARDAGHDKIARICEEILDDEEEMADWLRANLPRAVRDTLGELDTVRAGQPPAR
jgi:ferritin-like metal-binding protein YciE